jgi:ATP-dependent Zn protease
MAFMTVGGGYNPVNWLIYGAKSVTKPFGQGFIEGAGDGIKNAVGNVTPEDIGAGFHDVYAAGLENLKKVNKEKLADTLKSATTALREGLGPDAKLFRSELLYKWLAPVVGIGLVAPMAIKGALNITGLRYKARAEIMAESGKINELLKGALEQIKPDDVQKGRFSDIIGQNEAKQKFKGIVLRLKHTEFYKSRLGLQEDLVVPTIMNGPAGVGKTQMVRAMVQRAWSECIWRPEEHD